MLLLVKSLIKIYQDRVPLNIFISVVVFPLYLTNKMLLNIFRMLYFFEIFRYLKLTTTLQRNTSFI